MTTFTNMISKCCLTMLIGLLAIPAFAQVALFINEPSPLAGTYIDIGLAADDFGPVIETTYTGDLILADDGSAAPTEVCNPPILNALETVGNISLIDRGNCEFGAKVLAAENAGAIAVIICNNVPGTPITMGAGAVGTTVTIPSIMITQSFCDQIKLELANGPVNVSISNAFNLYGSTAPYAYLTPVDQIDTLQDITTTVTNRSTVDQSNITVYCDITNPAGVTTTLSESINTLAAGMDSTIAFTDFYVPATGVLGTYDVKFYNNGADIVGYEQGVDEETMGFVITGGQFGLDNNLQSPGGITVSGGGNFGMGSLYTIVQETDALSATFAISNPADLLGEFLTFTLYQVDANGDGDIDENGDGLFNDVDLIVLGLGVHEISAADVPDALMTAAIDNFDMPGSPITLSAGASYIILAEYIGTNTFFITASGATNYPGVATVVKTGTDWFSGGFTSGINGVVRLNVVPLTDVATSTPQLDADQVSLMPNPASSYVNIDLDLKEVSEKVEVILLDITGRIINTTNYNNIQQEVLRMDTNTLTAGTYFVHVRTEEGVKTLKLVIAGAK